MIVAYRIPGMTQQMMAATIRAAKMPRLEANQSDAEQAARLVEQIERLGYTVTLERVAA